MALKVTDHRFRRPKRTSKRKFLKDAKRLSKSLLPKGTALEKRKIAQRYADGYLGPKKWERWSWLIRNHRIARAQLKCLKEVRERLKFFPCLDPNKEQTKRLRSYFRVLVQEKHELEQLENAISEHKIAWKELAKTIRKLRPRLFLSHAFLNLSENSGIEVVSIFIGSLVAFGGIYMAFFYQAAAGLSASAYWTLNDLIVQGLLVIPLMALLLLLGETLFLIIQKVANPSAIYQVLDSVLKHSMRWVLGFFVVAAVGASIAGYIRGVSKFQDFLNASLSNENKKAQPSALQMATVLDGSVLEEVFLIGTTDRTATFLQPKKDGLGLSQESASPYFETASCVIAEILPTGGCKHTPPKLYAAFVMDRALVVCHGDMGDCVKPSAQSGIGNVK